MCPIVTMCFINLVWFRHSIPPLQQKPPSTIQDANLIYLPTFFVKEIESVHDAAKVEAFAIDICDKVFFRIGLAKIHPEGTATVFAVEWVNFDVLAGVGRFDFYAFDEELGRGDQGVRKERQGECYFFHGLKNFGAKKRVDAEWFGALTGV